MAANAASIAKNGREPEVREAALTLLADPALPPERTLEGITEVARTDPDPGVRKAALEMLTNQMGPVDATQLKSAASAALMVSAQLARIASDPDARRRALLEVDSQLGLGLIAKTDSDPRVRWAAFDMLVDAAALADVAKDTPDVLLGQAAWERLDTGTRIQAVQELVSQPLLAQVAARDPNPYVNQRASSKLSRPKLNLSPGRDAGLGGKELAALAREEANAAVDELLGGDSDPEFLLAVARLGAPPTKQRLAAHPQTPRFILAELARSGEDVVVDPLLCRHDAVELLPARAESGSHSARLCLAEHPQAPLYALLELARSGEFTEALLVHHFN